MAQEDLDILLTTQLQYFNLNDSALSILTASWSDLDFDSTYSASAVANEIARSKIKSFFKFIT